MVRFWGVRGSIACPGESHRRYGGNTSCLEVRCGEHLLVFDAGTGLRLLGDHLGGPKALSGDLFLTHTHLDVQTAVPLFTTLLSLPLPDDRYPPIHLSSQQQRQHTLEAFLHLVLLLVLSCVQSASQTSGAA